MPFLLKSKTPKMENFFQDKFFQIIFFFTWRSWKFQRFLCCWFWLLHWNQKLRKLVIFFKFWKFQSSWLVWEDWKFMRFPSFQFWPLYWNWKLWKLGTWNKKFQLFSLRKLEIYKVSKFLVLSLMVKLKTPGIWKIFQDLQFSKNLFYLRKSWIFDISEFLILVLILKSKIQKKLETFSKLANIKAGVLFEEVRNFWNFWIFYFGTYGEIENFKKLERSSRLINFK